MVAPMTIAIMTIKGTDIAAKDDNDYRLVNQEKLIAYYTLPASDVLELPF